MWIQANLFGTLERRIYSLVPHRFFKQLQIKYLLFFETGVFKKIFKIHRKTPLVDSLSDQPATCYDFKEGLPHRCFLWGLQTFKLACVFNIKLFFYGLILLIKSCKISYSNLDKALLFSRNQVFCLKNRKLWGDATTIELRSTIELKI